MEMPENRKKALIIAFYLSKFDTLAYKNLGFGTQTQTHKYIGDVLGVNPNTIKNMRDNFDPWEDNPRAGWYQRPLPPSRVKVKEEFDNLEEYSFHKIVKEFLSGNDNIKYKDIISSIKLTEDKEDSKEKLKKSFSVQMTQTGKLAEEYFKQNYINILETVCSLKNTNHKLIDTRLNGCGYDYEVILNDKKLFIEVKGIYDNNSNIRFTDKEWTFANTKRDTYVLVVIKNISTSPYPVVILNPSRTLNPEMNVQHVVQVSWITNIDN